MGSFIEIDMGPKNENRFMCAVPLLGTFRALWLVDAVHEGYIAGPLIGQIRVLSDHQRVWDLMKCCLLVPKQRKDAKIISNVIF